MGGRPVVYRGMLDCFRQILRHEGECTCGLTRTAAAEVAGQSCTPAALLKVLQPASAAFGDF